MKRRSNLLRSTRYEIAASGPTGQALWPPRNDNPKSILSRQIGEIEAIDAHTHVNSSHIAARGLHDILLYHMIVSDLYAAGRPSGRRLSDDPDEDEAAARIEEAIPLLEHVQNTSCYWLTRTILSDLYDWNELITLGNWRKLDARIRSRNADHDWPRKILRRARMQRLCTELLLRGDGSNDDILFYSLEWAFFMRNQWGVFDAPLYELEYAWQFDKPVRPLPVPPWSEPIRK